MDWASIAGFLILAFGLGWACFIGLARLGLPFTIVGPAGMLCPAIAALIVRRFRRQPIRGLGVLQLGAGRWYVAAYSIVPTLILSGAAIELASGYQRWALRLPPLPPALQMTPQLALAVGVVQALTVSALLTLPLTLGEELGWRGHLLPQPSPLGGGAAAVIVGIIWGLWHMPVIALFGLSAVVGAPGRGIKSWAIAPFFCLTTVPLGVIYAWLRVRSGSVWPCALAHAMANSGLAELTVLALSLPGSILIGGPIGLLGLIPPWAVMLWLILTGRLRVSGVRSANAGI